jgi:hypothetical protein
MRDPDTLSPGLKEPRTRALSIFKICPPKQQCEGTKEEIGKKGDCAKSVQTQQDVAQ